MDSVAKCLFSFSFFFLNFLYYLVHIILGFWYWGWTPWLHTSSLQHLVIVLHHAFFYLHAGVMGISFWCLQFKCCAGRLWLLTWHNLQSPWKTVLMRNLSLLSIGVGRLSPLSVTLFPRQGVLSSTRGGSQLRASKDPCVFPVSVGTMDAPLCFKFLPWLPCNNRPQLGLWANETLIPRAALVRVSITETEVKLKQMLRALPTQSLRPFSHHHAPGCHHQCYASVQNRGESRELWYPSYILLWEISGGGSRLNSPGHIDKK